MSMPRQQLGARVLGPYPHGRRWRLILIRGDGEKERVLFDSRQAAEKHRRDVEGQLACQARTLDEAIDAYERFLNEEKGNKAKSYKETIRRLRRFLGRDMDLAFSMLTPAWAKRCYDSFRTRPLKPIPYLYETPSVDYHRNALAEMKTFLNWCVGQHYTARNPFADVQGVGKRRHGKAQLRIDEARRWEAKALELAAAGEAGAACALAVLYCQLRASEAVGVQVRDLDDEGRILWVADSKTAAGRRQNEVPDHVRPLLQELAKGKKGTAPLFGYHDRGWPNDWVQEICRQAGVPVVCAHSQRGLASSLGFAAGVLGRYVAAALGHVDVATTTTSYATREAVIDGTRARGLQVLKGGK